MRVRSSEGGLSPTIFRSKRSDLVEQELYALLITYNMVSLFAIVALTLPDPRYFVPAFLVWPSLWLVG